MRKLASLEVIENLSPIPDATAIELAHIKGSALDPPLLILINIYGSFLLR
jgi:hypothetical protein